MQVGILLVAKDEKDQQRLMDIVMQLQRDAELEIQEVEDWQEQ